MTDGSKTQTALFLEAQGLPKLLTMGRNDEDEDNRKEAFDFIQAFADKGKKNITLVHFNNHLILQYNFHFLQRSTDQSL